MSNGTIQYYEKIDANYNIQKIGKIEEQQFNDLSQLFFKTRNLVVFV